MSDFNSTEVPNQLLQLLQDVESAEAQEQIDAWQTLADNPSYIARLPQWYGRTVDLLVSQGILHG